MENGFLIEMVPLELGPPKENWAPWKLGPQKQIGPPRNGSIRIGSLHKKIGSPRSESPTSWSPQKTGPPRTRFPPEMVAPEVGPQKCLPYKNGSALPPQKWVPGNVVTPPPPPPSAPSPPPSAAAAPPPPPTAAPSALPAETGSPTHVGQEVTIRGKAASPTAFPFPPQEKRKSHPPGQQKQEVPPSPHFQHRKSLI